jgi:hypothetical protein
MNDTNKRVTVTLDGVDIDFKSVSLNKADCRKNILDGNPYIELSLWSGDVIYDNGSRVIITINGGDV